MLVKFIIVNGKVIRCAIKISGFSLFKIFINGKKQVKKWLYIKSTLKVTSFLTNYKIKFKLNTWFLSIKYLQFFHSLQRL